MPKGPLWPDELRKPIDVLDLQRKRSRKPPVGVLDVELWDEIERRARVIEDFFRINPTTKELWICLLVALCDHWNIKAFHHKSATASRRRSRRWTDKTRCELFADVMAVKANNLHMTEHAACTHIAKNARRFGNRYLKRSESTEESWARTLHRQFIATKAELRTSPLFHALLFSKEAAADPAAEAKSQFGQVWTEATCDSPSSKTGAPNRPQKSQRRAGHGLPRRAVSDDDLVTRAIERYAYARKSV